MKRLQKTLLLLSLLVPLCGCNQNNGSSSENSNDDESSLNLKGDSLKSYELEDVSNSNGSAYYEILVGTYADSDGDGMGDFNGITAKLPYLSTLGIKGLWLMPIFDSNTYHKYDCNNYYAVDSDYGTMEDFENLVKEAKKYNIDIILDLVLNHTSSNHPFFQQSARDYASGNEGPDSKKDWYVWSKTCPQGYSKNYTANAYYEARFESGMPELNFDCPAVREEIQNVMSFWLNKGIKGFRLDAVTYYYYQNVEKNVSVLSWISDYCKSIKDDVYLVGEVYTSSMGTLSEYAASGVSVFNFALSEYSGFAGYCKSKRAKAFQNSLLNYYAKLDSINKDTVEDAPFLSNHDMDRSAGYLSDNNAKLAASVYLLTKGHPFIYYGEEIGLKGKRPPSSSTDADRRLAMRWKETDDTFRCKDPTGASYNTDPSKSQVTKGAEDNINDPTSLTYHYRKVLSIRNKYNDFIEFGKYENISTNDNAEMFKITYQGESIILVTNFLTEDVIVDLPNENYILKDEIRITKSKAVLANDSHKLLVGANNTVILK